MKDYLARKTLKTRRKLVGLLAPKIAWSLSQQQAVHNYMARTPRPMILFAQKYFAGKENLNGVEIGVAQADNALNILQELPVGKLYLIDPYMPYEFAGLTWDASVDYTTAHSKLADYVQAVWLRKTSESAVNDLQTERFDFVYIDGNHSYDFITKDITLYFPLVKNGGLFGGHDYIPFYKEDESVIRAVNGFAKDMQLELNVAWPDWWVKKDG